MPAPASMNLFSLTLSGAFIQAAETASLRGFRPWQGDSPARAPGKPPDGRYGALRPSVGISSKRLYRASLRLFTTICRYLRSFEPQDQPFPIPQEDDHPQTQDRLRASVVAPEQGATAGNSPRARYANPGRDRLRRHCRHRGIGNPGARRRPRPGRGEGAERFARTPSEPPLGGFQGNSGSQFRSRDR